MSLSGLLDVVAADPALGQALAAPGQAHLDLTAPPRCVRSPSRRSPAGLGGTGRPVLAVTSTGREAEDLVASLQQPADAGHSSRSSRPGRPSRTSG